MKRMKPGALSPKVDPVHDAVLALEQKGRLTPDAVIEAAKDPTSPLHDRFEWDDTAAAHQHRLQQARGLIRSVMVEITTEGRTLSTVHYVRDPSAEPDQGYVSLDKLRTEPENALAMLMQAFSQAKTYLLRAEEFADALERRAEVAHLSRELQSIVKRFSKH